MSEEKSTTLLRVDPFQTLWNVCFVHSSDGASSFDVTLILIHSNYLDWPWYMIRSFGGKDKFDFVDRTIPIPIKFDPSFKVWNSCNMFIHSSIMNSIGHAFAQSIVFLKIWLMILTNSRNFSQGNYIHIFEHQCDIFGLKQGSIITFEFFFCSQYTLVKTWIVSSYTFCGCQVWCVCYWVEQGNASTWHYLHNSILGWFEWEILYSWISNSPYESSTKHQWDSFHGGSTWEAN